MYTRAVPKIPQITPNLSISLVYIYALNTTSSPKPIAIKRIHFWKKLTILVPRSSRSTEALEVPKRRAIIIEAMNKIKANSAPNKIIEGLFLLQSSPNAFQVNVDFSTTRTRNQTIKNPMSPISTPMTVDPSGSSKMSVLALSTTLARVIPALTIKAAMKSIGITRRRTSMPTKRRRIRINFQANLTSPVGSLIMVNPLLLFFRLSKRAS
jgi:hypothetical protein